MNKTSLSFGEKRQVCLSLSHRCASAVTAGLIRPAENKNRRFRGVFVMGPDKPSALIRCKQVYPAATPSGPGAHMARLACVLCLLRPL